jgi:Lon protease-like protein
MACGSFSAVAAAVAAAFVCLTGTAGAQAPSGGAPPGVSPSPAGGLPAVIPIFPLPDTALFPNASHPFHIFEPRYRAMVADALKGDRIIGMVMLQPGYEADYEGRPPIFPIGCAGLITEYELLPDGRYNIVLGGLVKFRVTGEDNSRPYRLARIAPLPETLSAQATAALHDQRGRIEELLAALFDQLGVEPPPPGVPDEQVVDELSQFLPMVRIDRQRLLEQESPLARARALTDLLEGFLKEVNTPR